VDASKKPDVDRPAWSDLGLCAEEASEDALWQMPGVLDFFADGTHLVLVTDQTVRAELPIQLIRMLDQIFDHFADIGIGQPGEHSRNQIMHRELRAF
jgi:hypothetical protein